MKNLLTSYPRGRKRPHGPKHAWSRALSVESLEPRIALSAAGLIEVGTQPSGELDDKIVYIHAGHGYTADNLGSGAWSTQRPLLLGMVEDLGNQDQMTFLADYLWNAGATVVPLRPVGHQPNEVILDNDDPKVTFTGSWSDSTSNIYFGDAGDVPYRFASTSPTETATARYEPNLPEAGHYPVYAWTRHGSDRAADQLYKVKHAGGITEVTINHRRVGNGPIWLGTFYFEGQGNEYVEISNRSSELGRVVIADMIRFGNGVGDIDRGGGVSGFDREDEAGLYWVQWHVDNSQGISNSEYRVSARDSSATVSLSPRYAEFMNREADGSLSDRLFVSFHSNAVNGSARGVVALHNTNQGGATPNQLFLAQTLGRQVNDDLVAQNGQFEHNWADRGSNITFQTTFNFGEINNSVIGNEFDATIVETGFHDNQFDAELLRDPKVRDALARATYQGIVDYFNTIDGGATANIDLPGRVTDVQAESTGEGEVTLRWEGPAANSFNGGAATGYMIYTSTNGFGFDGGRFVAGGGTTTRTITGLDPAETYFFQVTAVNAGGQSPASEVVAAAPRDSGQRVLIVNGFDRIGRTQNPTQTFFQGGTLERVRPLQSNSFDYAVQVASALSQANPSLRIDTTANELIISGDVLLADYDSVFWILGEESTADDTFDATEQSAVAAYLSGGGKLFVSGAEIAWDLDNLGNGVDFFNNTLRAEYIADDANTYSVTGAAGSIFDGLDFSFDDGTQFYDVNFPDVISPLNGASSALFYAGGAGPAGVQFSEGAQRLVMLGFPFETITTEANRIAVAQRVLDFFDNGGGGTTVMVEQLLDDADGPTVFSTTGSWTAPASGGVEDGSFQFNLVGFSGMATWQTNLPLAGTAQVQVRYSAAADRATGAFFEAEAGGQSVSRLIDQTVNDEEFVTIGFLPVQPGPLTVTLDVGASTGPNFSLVVADQVRIVLTAPVTPSGDFNDDGFVDAADYTVWRDQLGQSMPAGEGADANFDGVVDPADYAVWREQFGMPAPVAVSAISTGAQVTDFAAESQSPTPLNSAPRLAMPPIFFEPSDSSRRLAKTALPEVPPSHMSRDSAYLLLYSTGQSRSFSAEVPANDPSTSQDQPLDLVDRGFAALGSLEVDVDDFLP